MINIITNFWIIWLYDTTIIGALEYWQWVYLVVLVLVTCSVAIIFSAWLVGGAILILRRGLWAIVPDWATEKLKRGRHK